MGGGWYSEPTCHTRTTGPCRATQVNNITRYCTTPASLGSGSGGPTCPGGWYADAQCGRPVQGAAFSSSAAAPNSSSCTATQFGGVTRYCSGSVSFSGLGASCSGSGGWWADATCTLHPAPGLAFAPGSPACVATTISGVSRYCSGQVSFSSSGDIACAGGGGGTVGGGWYADSLCTLQVPPGQAVFGDSACRVGALVDGVPQYCRGAGSFMGAGSLVCGGPGGWYSDVLCTAPAAPAGECGRLPP